MISRKAEKLTPYVAGLQPQGEGWIKLNTNENPYPPSPQVFKALANVDINKLRLYPDGDSKALCKAIGNYHGLDFKHIFCGNGSDEVLALAFQAFFYGKANVLVPDISYGFYPVWGEMYDVGLVTIPLNDDFTLDTAKYIGANGVVIANPNAPTSLAAEVTDIIKILQQNPEGVVLVDEAYIDFASIESAVSLIPNYENLLVVRTFSKSHSLAGLRVGYAVGSPALIDVLCRMRDAFNAYPLDMLAQAAAGSAVSDRDYLHETVLRIKKTRDITTEQLRELGCRVVSSQTNFLFVEASDATGLYEYLLENKIIVRHWNKPKISNFLRISIGTEKDMEALIRCVRSYTRERPGKQI